MILKLAKARLNDNVAWMDKEFENYKEFKETVRREILRPQTLNGVKLQAENWK